MSELEDMPPRISADQIPPAPDLSFEFALWNNESVCIVGLDEAGRGAWAGPVYAAAVNLNHNQNNVADLNGVRDSKQLTPIQRSSLAKVVKLNVQNWGIGSSTCVEIDEFGIMTATRLAMFRALLELKCQPHHLLIDALFLPDIPIPQTALIKGDQRSLSIAAASILAKTARDEWMTNAQYEYPDFGFARHKGYGTKAHLEALHKLGICPLHRKTFDPMKSLKT